MDAEQVQPVPDASLDDMRRALVTLGRMVANEWPAETLAEAVASWGWFGSDDSDADVRAVAAVFGDPVPE